MQFYFSDKPSITWLTCSNDGAKEIWIWEERAINLPRRRQKYERPKTPIFPSQQRPEGYSLGTEVAPLTVKVPLELVAVYAK